MVRRILFAEVPGFYAAIERAQDPSLAGRPVLVGGDPRKRGRVQSATADALAHGVELEMPMLDALQRCPQARAVRTDMARYREVSRRLVTAFRDAVPRLEALGLAAVYGELAGPVQADAELARRLRESVRERLGLPVRVGIARGKFLARLVAQEMAEEGFRALDPDDEVSFLTPLPVTRLDGVGRKTAAKLAELGAQTIGDVRALGRERLQQVFGPHGLRIFVNATGSVEEPVRATSFPQTISREARVQRESLDLSVLAEQLTGLAHQLEAELTRQGLGANRVTLKLRFVDAGTTTRTRTLAEPILAASVLIEQAEALLSRTQAGVRAVRSVGLQLAGLAPAGHQDEQLPLFPSD